MGSDLKDGKRGQWSKEHPWLEEDNWLGLEEADGE